MPGETWQQAVQMGKETVYGTAVAATRIAYTRDPSLTRERTPRAHEFATGTRERIRAQTLGPAMVGGSVTIPMSADELLEWLLISIKGAVSPTTPAGATLTRLWTFLPSATVDSMTIEYQDGANIWQAYGVRGAKISITGSVLDENIVTIDLFGKDRIPLGSLTGALASRLPTFIEGWQTRIFVDTFGGTPGTTQLSGLLINWTIDIELNLGRKYTADNTLAMNAAILGSVVATAHLTFEASPASVDTEYANWDAETNRLVSLEFGQNIQIEASPTNEVQTLTFGGTVSGGTYTINWRGQSTAAIAWNATAAQVQAALEAVPAFGVGNILVGGGPGPTALTLTFRAQLGGLNVPQVTITNNLTGTAPTLTPSTTTPGVGYKRAVVITLPGPWSAVDTTGEDAGTRTYEFGLQAIYDVTNAYSLSIGCYTDRTAAFA